MNIEEYRPINMDKIMGQEQARVCLLSILRGNEIIPRVISIVGPSGTGRLTIARNFIKSIYCTHRDKTKCNCGTCESCRTILSSEDYKEYDVSEIEELEYHKYMVIRAFDKSSRKEQKMFYDWFNGQEIKPVVILIMESTDDIIEDLKMLSLILRTSLLTDDEIYKSISDLNKRIDNKIPVDILDTIVRRSRGSLYKAHQMFDLYKMLDIEVYKEVIMSAREYYIAFLISCYRNKVEDVEKYIGKLKEIPLTYLKIDYESLILEIMKVSTKFEKPKDKLIEALVFETKSKALDLYYIMNDKIIYNSFTNEDTFQAAMYVIYLKLVNRIR